MLWKYNRVFRTHSTASGAAFATVIRLVDKNRINFIDTIDSKQAEVDTLHTVGTATEVNYRIPTPGSGILNFGDSCLPENRQGTICPHSRIIYRFQKSLQGFLIRFTLNPLKQIGLSGNTQNFFNEF